jgi:uncharacterized protein YwqG
MEQERLITVLKPLIRQCTELKLSATSSAVKQSLHTKFGGLPYSEKGEEWPICAKCRKELTFICQINTAECKHQTDTPALYTFFYCWECFPWGLTDETPSQWAVRTYTEPTLEKLAQIECKSDPQYETTPCQVECVLQQMLPDWDGLAWEAVNLCSEINAQQPWQAYESAITSLACLNEYTSHAGGYPKWIQGEEIPECRRCSSRMQLLAQIDSEDEASIMWGDAGSVYLFQCADHLGEFHLELQCS